MLKVSKEYTHIFTHNFLNIQLIFNPQKVLESGDFGPFNHTHIFTHNFLNIQLIFNPQKVLESGDLGLFNHTIKFFSKTFHLSPFLDLTAGNMKCSVVLWS